MPGTEKDIGNWRRVQELYARCGLKVRLHNFARRKTCPFVRIAERIFRPERILDLGCGNGLFTNYLSLALEPKEIIGIDICKKNIRIAQGTIAGRSNIRFMPGDLNDVAAATGDKDDVDYIILIDSLYLLPPGRQRDVINQCYRRLKQTGTLFIKTTTRSPLWKYHWTMIQDYFAINVLKLYEGQGVNILGLDYTDRMVYAAGFKDVKRVDLSKGYMYPHNLFICRKSD